MITLRKMIELRKGFAQRASENAARTGALVYAQHSREIVSVCDWLLYTDVDSVEIDKEAAKLVAAFTKTYAVEFDEFLKERASRMRRSQITEALEQLHDQVPSRAMSAAARQSSLGEAD